MSDGLSTACCVLASISPQFLPATIGFTCEFLVLPFFVFALSLIALVLLLVLLLVLVVVVLLLLHLLLCGSCGRFAIPPRVVSCRR